MFSNRCLGRFELCLLYWKCLYILECVEVRRWCFREIKDSEEDDNNCQSCCFSEYRSPCSTLYSLHCSFLGIRVDCVCFQAPIIQSLQRRTPHKTPSAIWSLTVVLSLSNVLCCAQESIERVARGIDASDSHISLFSACTR